MAQAIGRVLPLAVAIAVFPVPVIAAVLLLASERGRAKASAFVLAWGVGLGAVSAVVVVLADEADASDGDEPAAWVNGLLLAFGVLLLAAAVKYWRGRPSPGDETPIPGWMRSVHDFTIAKAGAAGFALSALNPKNLLLTAAAAVEIAEVGLPRGEQVVTVVVFVLLASLGVLAPLVATVVLGERSREPVDSLRRWMARHNAAIMAALFVVIGAKLIGDAIAGFSS